MRAGVDIGGTFTDLCIAGPDGIVAIGKALGTPAAPADSVETVLRDALEREAYELSQVVHATTLVTNALIERKGAKVALLATAGFRDVIELARERRPDIYRLDVWRPEPLVPRHLRFDVAERTLADGTIEQAVDDDDVEALAAELAERGIEAIAICFLHTLRQPGQRAARRGRPSSAPPRTCASRSPATSRRRSASTSARRPRPRTSTCRTASCATWTISRSGSAASARGGRLRVMLSNGGVATAQRRRRPADPDARVRARPPARSRPRGSRA